MTKDEKAFNQQLGKLIRIQRKVAKRTQVEIASQLGITFQQWQKYERGSNRISLYKIISFCKMINIPTATIIFDGSLYDPTRKAG